MGEKVVPLLRIGILGRLLVLLVVPCPPQIMSDEASLYVARARMWMRTRCCWLVFGTARSGMRSLASAEGRRSRLAHRRRSAHQHARAKAGGQDIPCGRADCGRAAATVAATAAPTIGAGCNRSNSKRKRSALVGILQLPKRLGFEI